MKHLYKWDKFNESKDINLLIEPIKDLLIELEDDGFLVTVTKGIDNKLYITEPIEVNKIEIDSIKSDYSLPVINISIIDNNTFKINQIKEAIKFIESYISVEFKLELNYIFIMKTCEKNHLGFIYYKRIEDIPDDIDIFSVKISFIKD